MRKIIIEGQREFGSVAAADHFCEELDANGQDWYSCTADGPRSVVYWGHTVELSIEEDRAEGYAQLARGVVADKKIAANAFNSRCDAMGRESAGKALADAAGFTGTAAYYFMLGFCGASAKACNPRAKGMEPAYKAGRLARNTPDGQRAARAAIVAARKEA